jgi:hypothetical protein
VIGNYTVSTWPPRADPKFLYAQLHWPESAIRDWKSMLAAPGANLIWNFQSSPITLFSKEKTEMMTKRYFQGVLCVAAIIHVYYYAPNKIEGVIGDYISVIYYTTWEIKRILQIPIIYGFLILAVQFLWSPCCARGSSDMSEEPQPKE